MSVTIPWGRGTGSRRADNRMAELRDENRRLLTLLAGADNAFMALRREVAEANDARDRANAKACRLDEAELYAAAVRDELLELRAFKATTLAVTVPAGERHIDPYDRPTEPTGIHVRPLWDALGIRTVTNPGHVGRPTA